MSMKSVYLSFLVTLVTCSVWAQDVKVIERPQRVVINSKGDTLVVEVEGKEGNPDFRYTHQAIIASDEPVVMKEKERDWEFQIPFKKEAIKQKAHYNFNMRGLGFGLVTALNAPEQMNVDMGASYEIMAPSVFELEYCMAGGKNTFSIGIGVDWKNYRMTGRNRFIKEEENIVLGTYPEGADVQFSRLKVFSWTLPLLYTHKFSRKLSFKVGPMVNFNTHASMKTCYKLAGEKVKLTDNNIHQSRVTVDLLAVFRVSAIGVYVKYSPFKVLNSDFGPDFSGLSTGLTLFY